MSKPKIELLELATKEKMSAAYEDVRLQDAIKLSVRFSFLI